jgi:hypothetical protein
VAWPPRRRTSPRCRWGLAAAPRPRDPCDPAPTRSGGRLPRRGALPAASPRASPAGRPGAGAPRVTGGADRRRDTYRPVIQHLEDERAAARLSVRRLYHAGAGSAGSISWELCYGGFPIASGIIARGESTLSTDVPALEAWMDDFALTLVAWAENGEPVSVEATCRRTRHRMTRAEATARSLWPGAREQLEGPKRGEARVAARRLVSVPDAVRDARPSRPPGVRRVVVYQDVHQLLAHRISRLQKAPRDREPSTQEPLP